MATQEDWICWSISKQELLMQLENTILIHKYLLYKKGSRVSDSISDSATFRGASAIEKNRAQYVKNGMVEIDAIFKSPSTAANFVTGRSTNGLNAWKDENGVSLKEILKK